LPSTLITVGGLQPELEGVRLVDVADRALVLLDTGGDALVALAADGAGGPLHLGALTEGPGVGVGVEELGEDRGGARAVRAVDRDDVEVRQVEVGVELGERRVVPVRDAPLEDVGDRVGVEGQPVERRVAVARVTAPNTTGISIGAQPRSSSASARSSSDRTRSDEPKSTVWARNCSMPPPEPIDW
jgi:hypothetical protein